MRPAALPRVLVAMLLAAVLAACGSSSSGGSTGTGSSGSSGTSSTRGPTVIIKDYGFHPSTLTVKVGTKVTFTNEDSVTHNATSSGGSGGPINSGTLLDGHSYTVTFTKPGTYDYICTIHPYMKAEVIVK